MEPMAGTGERARHWQYEELPGVDLLRARYISKTFVRHTHENFVIAAISDGVEVFHHGGADQYAGPGALALVNPDTPHTGRAGVPEGWRYGAVYPAPDLVAAIAAETTTIRGTPGFVEPVLDDPYAVRLVHEVLRAAEEGNALAADTLLRVAVTRLLRLNGGPFRQRIVRSAGARLAARARAQLEERLTDPPSLEQLAEGLQPLRTPSCLPGHLRHAAARMAHRRARTCRPTAPRRWNVTRRRGRHRRLHRPAAPQPALRTHRRGAARGVPAGAQERTRLGQGTPRTVRGVAEQTASPPSGITGTGDLGASAPEVPAKSDAAVVRDALGVGVAVGLSGFAFGVTSAGSGLSVLQTCALSLLVFTGASQFALVGALAAGGNPFTAAAGAFFLGVRNAFYGLRLSQLLALPRAVRPFAAQWVIDETTAVSLAQPTRRAARIGFAVTGLSLYVLWNLTTLLGALGAEAIGDTDAWGLDAAGPAVFLALLAPMLRTTTERAVAGIAVVLGLGLLPVLPAGVPVLVAALAAPAVLWLQGYMSSRTRDGAGRNGQRGNAEAGKEDR
jgi:predicted branched-subunit amino acid permease